MKHLLLAALMLVAAPAGAETPRVVALSWEGLEMLTDLAVTPVGGADLAGYATWVVQPALPAGITDIGLRTEPDLESIAALAPTLIVGSDQQADLQAALEQAGPVVIYDFFDAGHDNPAALRAGFRDLAARLGRADRAEAMLAEVDARVAAAGERVRAHFGGQVPPVVVTRLLSPTSVRVYGANSMSHAALEGMGLTDAASGPASEWGFALEPPEGLARFDSAILLNIEPFAEGAALFDSPLWQAMPFVQAGRFGQVRPVWTYGGPSSVAHLAEAIAEALVALPPVGAP